MLGRRIRFPLPLPPKRAAPRPDSLRAAKLLQSVAMGDFNGDGIMDFAVADFLSDNILVLLGDGERHFRLAAKLPSGGGPRSIVGGDFNHDGLMDLATADFFSGDVNIFLGYGDGSFGDPYSIHLAPGLSSLAVAGLDSDGSPELVAANFLSGALTVLKGTPDGSFAVKATLGPARAVSLVYFQDFYGDSRQDLIAVDASEKQAWLFAGNGHGALQSGQPGKTIDPQVAASRLVTQPQATQSTAALSQLRAIAKAAGDGQLASPGSVLPGDLVAVLGEPEGGVAAHEPMLFSNLYGGASVSSSSPTSTDDQGRVSAKVAASALPGVNFVATSASGGAAAVFGTASVLQPADFLKQVEAALFLPMNPEGLPLRDLLDKAQDQLKNNDVVGAVLTLENSLALLAQGQSEPNTGATAVSASTDLLKRLLNQVILFGSNLADVIGTISCGQTPGTITKSKQVNSYTFKGNSGDAVRFAALATSGSLCAVAALYSPSGGLVSYEDCNASTGSIGLSTTGTYTIKVYDHSLTNTGNYNLSLQFTTGNCSTGTGCGQTPSGNIGRKAQLNAYSFSANAGAAVRFAALATSGSLCAAAALYSPSGGLVSYEDCNASTGSIGLSTTGKYTILVYDHSLTNTGNYNLSLQFTTGNCSTGTGCGQTPSGNIGRKAQLNAYSFSANAGAAVRFAALATSGSLCAAAALYSPSGGLVSYEDCNASTGSIGLSTTGKYTILVYDHSLTNTGNYNLSLQFTTGNCSTGTGCGQTPSGNIGRKAQLNAYSFSANAGAAVRFAALATSGSLCAAAALYSPSGGLVSYEDCNASTGSIGLSTTGKYTILVYDHSLTNTGNYNLSLQFTTGGCATSLACGLPGGSGNITKKAQLDAYRFNAIAGQAAIISAKATSGSLCAVAALYSPSGGLVSYEDCNAASGSIGLPSTGRYTLMVYDHSLVNVGTYSVHWQFTTGCPICKVSPASLSFPTQLLKTTSAAKTATLTNTGNATMSITSIGITGINPGDFAQTHTCGTSLPVGGKCTVSASFKPTAKGTRTAAVSIADNAAPPNPQRLGLSGTGTEVRLVPASLSFGDQKVGTKSAPKNVTITNVGTTTLTISGISLTGTNAGDFSQTHTCGGTLGAGASCTISVTFHPSATGARSAAVSISDNGGGSPQKVSLSGTGT